MALAPGVRLAIVPRLGCGNVCLNGNRSIAGCERRLAATVRGKAAQFVGVLLGR